MISVIIPVYNAEKYLRQCLDSVLAQTYIGWECLLIDDGSIDSSGQICDEYASKDSRFRVFHKENGGVSSARNVGLSFVQGEYITFCDSDDCLLPNAFELYAKVFSSENEVDVIKGGYVKVNESSQKKFLYSCDETIIGEDKSYFVKIINGKSEYHGFLWNECIRSELCRKIRFDESLCWNEDNLFSYECFKKSRKLALIPNPVYCYFVRETISLSNVKDPFVVISTCNLVYKYRMQMLDDDNDNFEVRKQFENKYVNMFHYALKLVGNDSRYDHNEFKKYIPNKKILRQDFAAKLYLSEYVDGRVGYFLYVIVRKLSLIFKFQ